MQFIVRVGTTGLDAHSAYREYAGFNYLGPFDMSEAQAVKSAVETEWSKYDPENFVYGTPIVEVVPLAESNGVPWSPERTARNWVNLDIH